MTVTFFYKNKNVDQFLFCNIKINENILQLPNVLGLKRQLLIWFLELKDIYDMKLKNI